MFKKNWISILSAVGIFVVLVASCTTTPIKGRVPASEVVLKSDPESKKGFVQEFERASSGLDKEDINNTTYQLGVIHKWLRAHADSVNEHIDKNNGIISISLLHSLPKNTRKEKVFIVNSKGIPYQMISSHWGHAEHFGIAQVDNVLKDEVKKNIDMLAPYLAKAKAELPKLAEKIFSDQIFVGTNYKSQIFGRIEVVQDLSRELSTTVNDNIFGLDGLTSKQWSDIGLALREHYLFNPYGNTKIIENGDNAEKTLSGYLNTILAKKIQLPAGTWLEEWVRTNPNPNELQKKALFKVISELVFGIDSASTLVSQTIDQILIEGRAQKIREQYLQLQSTKKANFISQLVSEVEKKRPVLPFAVIKLSHDLTIDSKNQIKAGDFIVLTDSVAQLSFANAQYEGPYFSARDGIGKLEATEILKNIFAQTNLRRAEASFGEISYSKVLSSSLLSDTMTYFVPQRMVVEFDYPALRQKLELYDKKYPFEAHLKDYDRVSFRKCLAGSSIRVADDEKSIIPRIISPIINAGLGLAFNRSTSSKNLNQDNKHLLYCRMPESYRNCFASTGADVQDGSQLEKHIEAFKTCNKNLSNDEKLFYEEFFFGREDAIKPIAGEHSQSPVNALYDYEDVPELNFYDRYRFRESLMNPFGFDMPTHQILFYVRLNFEFRMCFGKLVIPNKASVGILGKSKAAAYEACKNGSINPFTLRREGKLTTMEKYYYETLILDRKTTVKEIEEADAQMKIQQAADGEL
jgi:hypothetical protein